MKTLKYLTICLVVCCLFTSSLFAQCTAESDENCACGIGADSLALFGDASGPFDPPQVARKVLPEDIIWWEITVNVGSNACYHQDFSMTSGWFPDGTPIADVMGPLSPQFDVAGPLCPVENRSETMGYIGPYEVDIADLGGYAFRCDGSSITVPPNKFQAVVCITASCRQPDGEGGIDLVPGQEAVPRPEVELLLEPCIKITKEAECDYSKPWDPLETITYTYTIENCGVSIPDDPGTPDVDESVAAPDVLVTSILDSQVGGDQNVDLITLAEAQCGAPLILAPEETCTFTDTYDVPSDDTREEIENTVVVNGVGNNSSQTPVTDSATETVDLVHPSFTVTCTDGVENEPGFADFEVCFTNTGDVPLNITSDCLIEPIVELPPADEAPNNQRCVTVREVIETTSGSVCGGGGVANLQCTATGTLPERYCLDNEVIETSEVCTFEKEGCVPNWTVEKTCLTSPYPGPDATDCTRETCALQAGDIARYEICISNTSGLDDGCDLQFLATEDDGTVKPVGPLVPGEVFCWVVEEPVPPCDGLTGDCIPMDENTVTVEAFCATNGLPLEAPLDSQEASATCCRHCGEPEGCTPGFWKNSPDCWCDEIVLMDGTVVTISEATLVSDVFVRLQTAPYDTADDDDRKSDFDTDDLSESIRYRGGGELAGSTRNMLRHATAALLNGCSSDVGYPVSAQMVTELVNFALDSQDIGIIQGLHMLLGDWNEDSPCPISSDNANEPCKRHDDVINGF